MLWNKENNDGIWESGIQETGKRQVAVKRLVSIGLMTEMELEQRL